jgi:hypothetical protein
MVNPDSLFRRLAAVGGKYDSALTNQLTAKWEGLSATKADEASASFEDKDPSQASAYLLAEAARAIQEGDKKKGTLFFQRSVSKYIMPEHYYFLIKVRETSPELSDLLLESALNALTQREMREANEALVLASYLFSPNDSISYHLISGYNAANIAGNVSATPKNGLLAKKYLTLVLNRLNVNDLIAPSVVYAALRNLLPQFRLLAPEVLDSVYAKMATSNNLVSQKEMDSLQKASDSYSLSAAESERGWADRLQKADKLDNANLRDLEYFTIVHGHLLNKKDFTRAYSVAERINDDTLRERLTDYIHLSFYQDKAGLGGGGGESSFSQIDFNSLVKKIKSPLIKVIVLCEASQSARRQKQLQLAGDLLDQALAAASSISDDQTRIQLVLSIAQLNLELNPQKGFETATEAVRQINGSSVFNIWQQTFTFTLNVYGMTNNLPLSTSFRPDLFYTIERMCSSDCTKTFEVSRAFQSRSIRLWTTLKATRIALNNIPKTPKT